MLAWNIFLAEISFAQGELHPNHTWIERGNPIIEHYTHFDYHGDPYVMSLVQDKRGIVYFTTHNGLHIFDGAQFQLVTIPDGKVWSLAIQGDSLWLGGRHHFGYLMIGQDGTVGTYHNLAAGIPDSIQHFGTVKKVVKSHGLTYFLTTDRLFIWDGKSLDYRVAKKVLRPYLFSVNEVLYYTDGNDLFARSLEGEQLVKEWSAMNDRVTVVLPHGENSLLIGGSRTGLFVLDSSGLHPFGVAIPSLKQNLLSGVVKLNNELMALASRNGGIYIIDKLGRLCQKIGRDQGLTSDNINSMTLGYDGSLWTTNDLGVNRINFSLPFTTYDRTNGLEHTPYNMVRHNGQLFVGTGKGVYRLQHQLEEVNPSLVKVPGTAVFVINMMSTPGGLLVAQRRKPLLLIDDNLEAKIVDEKLTSVERMRLVEGNPKLMIVTDPKGIHLLEQSNGEWVYLKNFFPSKKLWDFDIDEKGNIWIQRKLDLFLIETDPETVKQKGLKGALLSGAFTTKNFSTDQGVGMWPIPYRLDNQFYIIDDGKLLEYDDQTRSFVRTTRFGPELQNEDAYVLEMRAEDNGDVWFIASGRHQIQSGQYENDAGVNTEWLYIHAIKGSDGQYTWDNELYQPLQRELGPLRAELKNGETIGAMLIEDDVAWFGGISGKLLRIERNRKVGNPTPFPLLIKKVRNLSTNEVLFNGFTNELDISGIPFSQNRLLVDYSGITYDQNDSIYFRYRLNGADGKWSSWTHQQQRELAGLYEGTYSLELQAFNPYGQNGQTAILYFNILPPWYRTLWAYFAYVLLALGFVYGIITLRERQLRKEHNRLERLVDERTLKLKEQATTLKAQATKLREMDKVKTRFFANISHEFRTPLTLIRGPLKNMINGTFTGDSQAVWSMMYRNANRLLHLINQLLDLSKLEAGKMTLRTAPHDLVHFLKLQTANYHSLAETNDIDYQFHTQIQSLEVFFDAEKMEKVVQNLISNAFKFTPEKGSIHVSLDAIVEGEKSWAEIVVRDTGIGIANSDLEKIFMRFHQVDDSHTRTHEGTGIGLALAKELVELHKGSISVESEEGNGTTFKVQLLMGVEHLSPEEILQDAQLDENADKLRISSFLKDSEMLREEKPPTQKLHDVPDLLIVEDNPDMREYLRMTLEQHYRLTEAVDGEEGIAVSKTLMPDLIISDVMMPKVDGVELCESLKNDELTSHIPIILLTAKANRDSRMEGLAHGADDYLAKPFDQDELLVIIKNRIDQRRKLREKYKSELSLGPKKIDATSSDQKFLNQVMELCESRLNQSDFQVEEFAHEIGMSTRQLQRKLLALTGQSPNQFIRNLRLMRAAQLLEAQTDSVSQIAYEVGFNTVSYFAKCFKDRFQMTPQEYIKKHKKHNLQDQ